jgi:hypothetical protein
MKCRVPGTIWYLARSGIWHDLVSGTTWGVPRLFPHIWTPPGIIVTRRVPGTIRYLARSGIWHDLARFGPRNNCDVQSTWHDQVLDQVPGTIWYLARSGIWHDLVSGTTWGVPRLFPHIWTPPGIIVTRRVPGTIRYLARSGIWHDLARFGPPRNNCDVQSTWHDQVLDQVPGTIRYLARPGRSGTWHDQIWYLARSDNYLIT